MASCLRSHSAALRLQVTAAMVSGSDLCADPELLRAEDAGVERARRAVETFLLADLDSEDPEEVLRRALEEYRAPEDRWEDSVTGGAGAPDSERPVPGSSAEAGSVVTPGGPAGGEGARRDGGARQRPETSADSTETPVVRPCPDGAAVRPPGAVGSLGGAAATRGEASSSRSGADTSSAPTTVPRVPAAGPGARYRAVYSSSDDQTRRSVRSGASEGPLCDRGPREQSSTWSEDPEGPLTRPASRAEGHTAGLASDAPHAVLSGDPGGPKRSSTWSSEQPVSRRRPAPPSGSGERPSNISEDPIGRPGAAPSAPAARRTSETRSVATGSSDTTERLFAHSRVSQTPVIRAEPGERAATGARASEATPGGPGGVSTADLTAGPSDWSMATSKRANSGLFDSCPRPTSRLEERDDRGPGDGGGGGACGSDEKKDLGGENETTPTERRIRGGYFYSRFRCETLASTSSGLGVSEGSALAAEVTEGSVLVSEGSAGSARGDWWLVGRPLKRARTEAGGAGHEERQQMGPRM